MLSAARTAYSQCTMKPERPQKLACCEVVRVDCAEFLVNSERHACRYQCPDGAVLAAGYYLVCWPLGSRRACYGPDFLYLGPYASLTEARFLYTSALSLGLVEPDPVSRPPAPSKVFSLTA